MSELEFCEACGQQIKLAHKEFMNKNLLTGLQSAARSIIDRGVNDFDLHELFGQYNVYNNFQKLRYFGLVHHVVDRFTKSKTRGHWLITRNGWAFLRGELEVHKWVKIRNNKIIERSSEMISVRDVYFGSEAVATMFEYFDDNGNMVGVRPISKVTTQTRLI